MKNSSSDLLNIRAAAGHLVSQGMVSRSGFTSLAEMQRLVLPDKKQKEHQHWTFIGDWKRSVSPVFNAK